MTPILYLFSKNVRMKEDNGRIEIWPNAEESKKESKRGEE